MASKLRLQGRNREAEGVQTPRGEPSRQGEGRGEDYEGQTGAELCLLLGVLGVIQMTEAESGPGR